MSINDDPLLKPFLDYDKTMTDFSRFAAFKAGHKLLRAQLDEANGEVERLRELFEGVNVVANNCYEKGKDSRFLAFLKIVDEALPTPPAAEK